MRILVVDDDGLVLDATTMLVEDLGHTAVSVHSGFEALDLLESSGPFDLVVSDYSMPRMNGLQLITLVNRLYPQLPVLMATGYAVLPAEHKARFLRLAKPFDGDKLAEAIAEVMTHHLK